MTQGSIIRPKSARLALGVIFVGLSVAVLFRGGEVSIVSAFVFSMTGLVVGDIFRNR